MSVVWNCMDNCMEGITPHNVEAGSNRGCTYWGSFVRLVLEMADLFSNGGRDSIVKAVAAIDKGHYNRATKFNREELSQLCRI